MRVSQSKNKGDSFALRIFTRESFPSIFFWTKKKKKEESTRESDGKYMRETPGIKSEDVVNTRNARLKRKTEKQGGGEGESEKPGNSTVTFDFWFCIAVHRPGRKAL